MTDITSSVTAQEDKDARWNVACAFIIFFTVLGIPAIMIPVLYGPIIDDTGWSRGDVSLLSSLKFAAGAITAYLSGRIIERHGIRAMTIFCSVLSGLSLMMMMMVQSLTMLYAVGIFLGIGALGVTTGMKIFISQWFTRRQGVAIGLSLMGTSAAGVVVPYIATLLSEAYGWRATCAIMSLGIWLIALPVFIWRAKEKPRTPKVSTTEHTENSSEPTFRDIRFGRVFIFAALINFLIGMVDHGMSAHLVIYFSHDIGLGVEMAAIGYSLVMLMSNFGKVGYGWLFDRMSTRGIAFCWFLAAIGVGFAFPVSGMSTLIVFALIYGPTQGGMIVNIPVLAKHCFGSIAMIRAIAVLTTCFMAGSAAGPAIAGYLHDITGSYALPFGIFVGSAVVAGFLTLTLRPAYHRTETTQPEPAQNL